MGKPPKQLDINDPINLRLIRNSFAVTFINPSQFKHLCEGDAALNGNKPAHLIIDTSFDGATEGYGKRLDEIIEQAVMLADKGEIPI